MNLKVKGKLEIMIHHQSFISFKNTFLFCKSIIVALLVSNVMHKLFVIMVIWLWL